MVPLIAGGLLIALVPWVTGIGIKIAMLVIGTGLTGPIYVLCALMIAEFTPSSRRGAVIAIFGTIFALAEVIAPYADGSVIEQAATALDGYQTGYLICVAMQVAGGGSRPHQQPPECDGAVNRGSLNRLEPTNCLPGTSLAQLPILHSAGCAVDTLLIHGSPRTRRFRLSESGVVSRPAALRGFYRMSWAVERFSI